MRAPLAKVLNGPYPEQLTRGGARPGHDAKLKKALVRSALEGGKRAVAKLEALGWTKFLDAAKEKQQKAAEAESGKISQKPAKKRSPKAGDGEAEAPATDAQESGRALRSKGPPPQPAEAPAEAAPNLQPPLSEETAHPLGFGKEPAPQAAEIS